MTNTQFSPREVIESECDRFNFEKPGKIQSHGAMLIVQEPSLNIVQLSQNTDEILGINHRQMINQPIVSFLDEKSAKKFQKTLSSTDFSMVNPLRMNFQGTTVDLILHRYGGFLFAEAEPIREVEDNNMVYQMAAMQAVEKFQSAVFIEQLMEIATNEIREVTGFDRVMLYKFDEEFNGQVVNESSVRGIDSFLNLHFPSSDIPRRVRNLYLNTKSRYLPDLPEPQVALFPEINPITNQSVDLGYAVLRAVAPTHMEYMRNLGVNSSLSFNIIKDGRFYGMFACHHRSGKYVAYVNRLVCEQIVEMFVAMLHQLDNDEIHLKRLGKSKDKAIQMLQGMGSMDYKSDLLGMVNADGAAIFRNGQLQLFGFTPDENDVRGLIQLFADKSHNILYQKDTQGFFVTSKLAGLLDGAERIKHAASGVLVVPISQTGNDYVMWFRPERIIAATWGGNPDQAINIDEKTMRISPRKSFSAWKKNVENSSETWKSYEIQMAVELRNALLTHR